MIEDILELALEPVREAALRECMAAHLKKVRESVGHGDRSLIARAEREVTEDRNCFSFDSGGVATLSAAGHSWSAGRFETPSIGELKEAARLRHTGDGGFVRLWVLDGVSPLTDIGTLQAWAGKADLFQVASQFNCLESPGPRITNVSSYLHDPTQGPRASISTFPGTLLRHYVAPGPDGTRFEQREGGPMIDLLSDAIGPGDVVSGYLSRPGQKGPAAIAERLQANFDRIRVGVHAHVEVVLGYDWDGSVEGRKIIAQAFTSTVAGGGYGGERNFGRHFQNICSTLLKAGYFGTLLAGLNLRRRHVFLTLIGGGVFGNPFHLIWESILWAVDQTAALATEEINVVLNGYDLSRQVDVNTLRHEVRRRGGAIIQLDRNGLKGVLL